MLVTLALTAIGGTLLGAIAMYAFNFRVERAIRMMLDRREQDLAAANTRIDQLVQQVVSLRRDGFTGSRAGEVRQAPDQDGEALARAEGQHRKRISDEQFLTRAVAQMRKDHPGVSEEKARREARRLLEAARMEQPPA